LTFDTNCSINFDDTLAIYNNYNLTHAFKTAQTTTVNPQLSIVLDQPFVTKGNSGEQPLFIWEMLRHQLVILMVWHLQLILIIR
jgi:hypothetical protein